MGQVVLLSPYFTDEKTVFQVVFSTMWGIGQLPEWVMVLMLSLAAARAQDNNPTFLTPCFSCAQHTPWIFDNIGVKITPYCTDYHINICVNEHLFSVFESPTLILVLIFTLAICANIRRHWHGYWKWAIRPPSRTMLLTQVSQTLKFAVTSSFKIKARIEESYHQVAINILSHGQNQR